MQFTNAGEIAGFFLARAIVVVLMAVGAPFVIYPLYSQLLQAGGAVLVALGAHGVNFVGWLVTLTLFLLLRSGFGGVPPRVAGRRDAVTSSGGEIAAFLIAVLIVMIALAAFSFVLIPFYAELQRSGQVALVVPISLAVSAMASVVFFLVFIAIRGVMPGVVSTEEPIEPYDDGGAPMGFGRAIATCLRKYAVFRGRASRSEYWFFVLFQLLLFIALMLLDMSTLRADVLARLAFLILFLPGLAVTVRRLHDVDMSGWSLLVIFVPVIGSIFMLLWTCQPGTKGPNRFGIGRAAIPEVFA